MYQVTEKELQTLKDLVAPFLTAEHLMKLRGEFVEGELFKGDAQALQQVIDAVEARRTHEPAK